MHGGVTGKAGDSLPMSILDPSFLLWPCYLASDPCDEQKYRDLRSAEKGCRYCRIAARICTQSWAWTCRPSAQCLWGL